MRRSLAKALDDLAGCSCEKVRVDEAVQVAVQDALGVPDLVLGAVILD
jgi:hypothetical protein